MAQICGVCKENYADRAAYLAHTCSVTGFNPTQPEHFGERFILQSKKALQRTGSLDATKEAELDGKITTVKSQGVDDKIMRATVA